jgi:hypothetical protein
MRQDRLNSPGPGNQAIPLLCHIGRPRRWASAFATLAALEPRPTSVVDTQARVEIDAMLREAVRPQLRVAGWLTQACGQA